MIGKSNKFIVFFLIFLDFFCFLEAATKSISDSNIIYLVSYPRSGNKWTRLLISEIFMNCMSGFTSVYNEKSLEEINDFFIKKSYQNSQEQFFLIKSHYPALKECPGDKLPYSLAIRLIRDPIESFYSYYCFKVLVLKLELPPFIEHFNDSANQYIQGWRRFHSYWDEQPNVLTIRYEDLYENPDSCLRKIVDKIGYPIEASDIERALFKYPPIEGGGIKTCEELYKRAITDDKR